MLAAPRLFIGLGAPRFSHASKRQDSMPPRSSRPVRQTSSSRYGNGGGARPHRGERCHQQICRNGRKGSGEASRRRRAVPARGAQEIGDHLKAGRMAAKWKCGSHGRPQQESRHKYEPDRRMDHLQTWRKKNKEYKAARAIEGSVFAKAAATSPRTRVPPLTDTIQIWRRSRRPVQGLCRPLVWLPQ